MKLNPKYRIVNGKYNDYLLKKKGELSLSISYIEGHKEYDYKIDYESQNDRDKAFENLSMMEILKYIDSFFNFEKNNFTDSFNAEKARKIANESVDKDLEKILMDIKIEADKSNFYMHLYHDVKPSTIDALIKRGFVIKKHDSLAIQKDNLFFTISW